MIWRSEDIREGDELPFGKERKSPLAGNGQPPGRNDAARAISSYN